MFAMIFKCFKTFSQAFQKLVYGGAAGNLTSEPVTRQAVQSVGCSWAGPAGSERTKVLPNAGRRPIVS
jgi:hypothetical protein